MLTHHVSHGVTALVQAGVLLRNQPKLVRAGEGVQLPHGRAGCQPAMQAGPLHQFTDGVWLNSARTLRTSTSWLQRMSSTRRCSLMAALKFSAAATWLPLSACRLAIACCSPLASRRKSRVFRKLDAVDVCRLLDWLTKDRVQAAFQ